MRGLPGTLWERTPLPAQRAPPAGCRHPKGLWHELTGDPSKKRGVIERWTCSEWGWRRFLLAARSSTDDRAQVRPQANPATSCPALEQFHSGNNSDGTRTVSPSLVPHWRQGQPWPNPSASPASPWPEAPGILGGDSILLLPLSWSPRPLARPRKCTVAFVSLLLLPLPAKPGCKTREISFPPSKCSPKLTFSIQFQFLQYIPLFFLALHRRLSSCFSTRFYFMLNENPF